MEIEDIANSNSPKPITAPSSTNKEPDVIQITEEPSDLPPLGIASRPSLELGKCSKL